MSNRMLPHRRRKLLPRFMVIHHTNTASPADTFRILQRRGLSTHYEVDQLGSVIEYLDPATCVAYHARWANGRSIGIDITHLPYVPWPAAQVEAVKDLILKLAAQFNIPVEVAPDPHRFTSSKEVIDAGYGILRHRNIIATACPEDFPLDELFTDMEAD